MFHSENFKLIENAETKYCNISYPFSFFFYPELFIEFNLTAVNTCPDETAFLSDKYMFL